MGYSQTYASIIVILLGWLGIGHFITQAEVGTFVDNVLQIGGLIYTLYRRHKSGDVTVLGFRK